MSRRRFSTAVRLFDLRLASNRFVLAAFALGLAGFAAFRAVRGDPLGLAVSRGLEAAFSVLLSWALARELHPDQPASAAAAGIAGFLIFLTGQTNLGAVTALLFAVRVTARSPGLPPTNFDLVWLPVLAAYTTRSSGGFLAGLALAAALAWDAEAPAQGRQILSAVAAAGLALSLATVRGTLEPDPVTPTAWQWIVLGVALFSLPWLRIAASVSVGDLSGVPLSQARLVRARALAVITGGLAVMWLGGAAAPALVGLWAALVGIAVVRSTQRPDS